MKITVLDGDYVVASRARMLEIVSSVKNRGWEVVRFAKNTKYEVIDKLATDSLFASDVLYIIENPALLPTKGLEKISANLLIWHKGTLPAKIKKTLPKETKFERFDLPKKIFKLFDAFYPGNAKQLLALLHEVVETDPIEFVFALLARQMRDLYWATISANSLPYPSWRVGKLKAQARKFSDGQIKKIINMLAKIDIETKTSKADLLTELDLLIVKELE